MKPHPPTTGLTPPTHNQRQLAEAYLQRLEAQHYSPRTLEKYRDDLLPFISWCEARGWLYAPQISLSVLESYQRYLSQYRKANGALISLNSQIARLSLIKRFYRWLFRQQVILYNVSELLSLPKEARRLPRQIFSEQETRQVLGSIDTHTPRGLRDRAMLEVLWSSGIRRIELANLRLGDIDLHRGALMVVQGKGKKDRVVPLGQQAVDWVQRYLLHARPKLCKLADSGHLFISHRGQGLKRSTLTQIGGDTIRNKARLNKPGACHIFRHSMATQMLDNGADSRHIQAILGHEKLETTQIYTRVAIGQLQKVHAQTHPAEKRQGGSLNRSSEGDKPSSSPATAPTPSPNNLPAHLPLKAANDES